MEDRIQEWELVDKILFAALLSVVTPGQREVTYRELLEADYTDTSYLLSVYLRRLVRKCHLSVINDRWQDGDIRFRFEEPTGESIDSALSDYLNKVNFDVKCYRLVCGELLHQIVTDECMRFVLDELKSCQIYVNSHIAPPNSIYKLLKFNSMQKACTLLKLATKNVLDDGGRVKQRAMEDMQLLDGVCKSAYRMSNRYAQICTLLEGYDRDVSHKRSAVSYLLTEVVCKFGPEYYRDDELWMNAYSGPFDPKTLFPDTSPYSIRMGAEC